MKNMAYILFVFSIIALGALLVGAMANVNIEKESRITLWCVFIAGLVVGGIFLLLS